MSLQAYYEDSYSSENKRSPQDLLSEVVSANKALTNFVLESKSRFQPDLDWAKMNVLELGAGRGGVSLALSKLGAKCTLVDFSASAISQAEKIFALEGAPVSTLVADVTHPDTSFSGKFDLIVDSHLLHCLTGDPDRSSYYKLVHDYLTPQGIFVSESMVHRKKMFIPDGFMFDERNVLWQMFGKWTPVRRILDSLDLEDEIKRSHFEIVYFIYYGQYAFVPHKDFMDIPSEVLPAAVRMVLKKN